MFGLQIQFISGCMVGIELLTPTTDKKKASALVLDLVIIRVMFIYIERD